MRIFNEYFFIYLATGRFKFYELQHYFSLHIFIFKVKSNKRVMMMMREDLRLFYCNKTGSLISVIYYRIR